MSFNKWHPYSIKCGYLLFFESTIMRNTADLAMVQKMIIDTLHKEGKTQRGITERGAVQGVLYQSILNVHKQQRRAQAWEYCQAKPIQTLERASQGVNWSWSQCIKSHHAQTSSGKEIPSPFWNRNIIRSILPGLRRKTTVAQWSKVLFTDEIKCCISFGNQGPRVWRKRGETQNPCCLSPVWSFHSQWWFGLPWRLLVLVHCVFWSPQSTQPSTRKY